MIPKGKPKNQRTKRALEKKAPKLVESTKISLMLKGPSSSETISKALKDLHKMKAPDSKLFQKKNMTRPFEDQSSIEFLAQQNDCPLFAYGSHSKKRPNNLILGRCFDHQLLDMIEFGIDKDTFKPMDHFEGKRQAVVRPGGKPMFIFVGEEFETNENFKVARNLFLDFFRGEVLEKINLASLDRVISCTAHGEKIFFRQYGVLMKKSGSKFPRIELEEVGPTMDLSIRRRKQASDELVKAALKVAKPLGTKRKNIETGHMGDTMGRVYKQKQDYNKIALAKQKGRKRTKVSGEASASASASASAPASTNASQPANTAADNGDAE